VTDPPATPSLAFETTFDVPRLDDCLGRLTKLHARVCPRQVLGVRIGLHAGSLLGLDLPRTDKRLMALVETDGCFADGVSVATGCWLGRRTLRLIDYGKVAATIVDIRSGRAFRLWPHPAARARASTHAPAARSRWHAQMSAYQSMPIEQLLCVQQVELAQPVRVLIGRPGRAMCAVCGEEILNQRVVASASGTRCRGCAGDCRYYRELDGSVLDRPLPAGDGTRS
jgi:formylmethanofuran dehydrogenase subunit E